MVRFLAKPIDISVLRTDHSGSTAHTDSRALSLGVVFQADSHRTVEATIRLHLVATLGLSKGSEFDSW
jgi:hypothetical protein